MGEALDDIKEEIEAIKLPEGYSFFWDAQYKSQKESMNALTTFFPLAFLLLIAVLIALFGNYRQPLIILLILPLSIIGVVFGLLISGLHFSFFCIVGWIGLLGMIIKNVIVLLDEVNNQIKAGRSVEEAAIESTVTRIRPVTMAVATTVLGMIPLLWDVVFNSMAVTIIAGLSFATLLTLVATPVLYVMFYSRKKGICQ